jgi:ribosome maturation factor RimP
MLEKDKSPKILEIEETIRPVIEQDGFILVEVQILEGKDFQISVFIYKEKDATIENLGKINRRIYPILETIPFLKNGFSLEVSSPGIFRKIKYSFEFNVFKGRELKLVMENGDIITGIIDCLENDELRIKNKDSKITSYKLNEINKASLNG